MKSKLILNKLAVCLSAVCVVLAFIVSCKKDIRSTEQPNFPQLRAFYEANQPLKESLFVNTKPIWGSVNRLEQDNFYVFEVALENPNGAGITSRELTKEDMDSHLSTHSLKLLLFVDTLSGKTVKGCYMAVEASDAGALANVHYRQTNGLNGKVVYYNLDGSFSNGVVYIDGKARYTIQDVPVKEMMALKKKGKGMLENDRNVVQTTCSTYYIETGYVYCVYTPYSENCGWQFTGYASYTVCGNDNTQPSSIGDGYGSGGGSNNGPPLIPDCAGVLGGSATWSLECNTCIGGTTGLTACPKDIRNKTQDSCISANVNSLLNSSKNIEGKMAEIIKKFDISKTLNINIYDGQTSNGKPGEMFNSTFEGSIFTANIRLQTSYFKGQDAASKESLAAILIHEVLHGYIKSQNPNLLDNTNIHHNMMVQNYIEPLSNYLAVVFGISRKDAFSLAWNGVIDSDVFDKADADKLFDYTYTENGKSHTISISKQEIKNRALAYNGNTNYADEGKKGTKTCLN